MTLATPARPVDTPGHALAPLLLPQELQLTAEQFQAVCQANGAQLSWLLIPEQQAVEVWPATSLDAGSLFPGLQIDLLDVWQG